MSDRESVRKRPGMYVGNADTALLAMVLEVIGNAIDQHLAGACNEIAIRIASDGTVTVADDGPGIAAEGSGSLPPIVEWLTVLSRNPTVDGHKPHTHFGPGMGLFPVNALSERFELVTVRGGRRTRFMFERGLLVGEPEVTTTEERSGTRVTFRPDAEVLSYRVVPILELAQRIDDLSFVAPRLRIALAIDSTPVPTMRERIARESRHAIDDVAHHAARYETASGPIDVEVAFAWDRVAPAPNPAIIHSFANLKRTTDNSVHVIAFREALAQRLDVTGTTASGDLVAGIAVVLTDVLFGTPLGTRLDSEEARPVVKTATHAAFDAWAPTHAEQIALIRERERTARDNSGNRPRRR